MRISRLAPVVCVLAGCAARATPPPAPLDLVINPVAAATAKRPNVSVQNARDARESGESESAKVVPHDPCGTWSSGAGMVECDPSHEPMGDGEGFDFGAALHALRVDLEPCKKLAGPVGVGRVSVTFAATGLATAVSLSPPYAATPKGACITDRFRATRVPVFSGDAVTTTTVFDLP